jgi:hypothetical protein
MNNNKCEVNLHHDCGFKYPFRDKEANMTNEEVIADIEASLLHHLIMKDIK